MKCIYCGDSESKVLDSRVVEDNNSIRRRRECLKCGKRFTTYEVVERSPILVVKNDNSRQIFDRNKLKSGIIKACEKRPVSISQIDAMIEDIEKQLTNSLEQEVKSTHIGEMIMERLRAIDEVAYIRFASVYRKFADITHFMEFIREFDNK